MANILIFLAQNGSMATEGRTAGGLCVCAYNRDFHRGKGNMSSLFFGPFMSSVEVCTSSRILLIKKLFLNGKKVSNKKKLLFLFDIFIPQIYCTVYTSYCLKKENGSLPIQTLLFYTYILQVKFVLPAHWRNGLLCGSCGCALQHGGTQSTPLPW